MKVVIQIPCYNEEKTLPQTLADLPRSLPGVDAIEIQVIDDGSTDRTQEVARSLGVRHVVAFRKNKGLAAAFKAGVDNALALGADVLVNTDGDNQYRGSDVAKIVAPIVAGRADIVIGCRPIDDHPEFSFVKKHLQRAGSWVLRTLSNTEVRDAASGFRAYSRDALLHVNIYSEFSYCMETLIQAGLNNLKIESADIAVNLKTRESRLFRSVFQYIWKQAKTMIGIFILYRANVFFNLIAIVLSVCGLALAGRHLYLGALQGTLSSAVSLPILFGGLLVGIGFQVFLTGILASLISSTRKLSEDVSYRLKRLEGSGSLQEDED